MYTVESIETSDGYHHVTVTFRNEDGRDRVKAA